MLARLPETETVTRAVTPSAADYNRLVDAITALEGRAPDTAPVPPGTFDVTVYGAVGDGVTNDRAAFHRASAAARAAGGGTITGPARTYRLAIDTPGADQHCWVLDGDAITVTFPAGTVLDCHVYGGDPDTEWQVVDGQVWRGGGIFVTGGRNGTVRRDVTFRGDWHLRGNFTRVGSHAWPADPATGDGWDVTHKGIWFEGDTAHDGHLVDGVTVSGFAGELVYSGGDDATLGTITVRRATLHTSNASLVSCSARRMRVLDCTLTDTAGHGIENAARDGLHEFAGNVIAGTGLDGISFVGYGGGSGGADIHHNRIRAAATGYGIGLYSAWSTQVHHNRLTDCGIRGELGHGYPNPDSRDVAITDNVILADTRDVAVGINVGLGAGKALGWRLARNRIGATEAGTAAGVAVVEPIAGYPDTDWTAVALEGNQYTGTHGDTSRSVGRDVAVGTSVATVLAYRPSVRSMLVASVSYRVTAPTTLTVRLHDGARVVATLVDGTVEAGTYALPGYLVPMAQRQSLTVQARAGASGAVTITGTIREA